MHCTTVGQAGNHGPLPSTTTLSKPWPRAAERPGHLLSPGSHCRAVTRGPGVALGIWATPSIRSLFRSLSPSLKAQDSRDPGHHPGYVTCGGDPACVLSPPGPWFCSYSRARLPGGCWVAIPGRPLPVASFWAQRQAVWVGLQANEQMWMPSLPRRTCPNPQSDRQLCDCG